MKATNKFINNLTASNDSIKETRASRLAKSAKMSQEKLVRDLESEILSMETQYEDLTDMSPTNKYDLKFNDSDFDADRWAETIQRIKVDISLKKQELRIAQETMQEWFGEEEVKTSESNA